MHSKYQKRQNYYNKQKNKQKKSVAFEEAFTAPPAVQTFDKSWARTTLMGVLAGICLSAVVVLMVALFQMALERFSPQVAAQVLPVLFDLRLLFAEFIFFIFVCLRWFYARPCLSISANEIIISRKNKPDVCYLMTPSLHIKMTMLISRIQNRRAPSTVYCFLFLTFTQEGIGLKQRWMSGFYINEQAKAFIFALEDHHVRYSLEGFGANYFVHYNNEGTKYYRALGRKVKASTYEDEGNPQE